MNLSYLTKRVDQLIELGNAVLATSDTDREFDSWVANSFCKDVEAGIAILESIKDEISGGWLFSVKGLVTAEIFADFLEMAQYLLDQGYHTPAAVMAGSVLEEHLRQLCNKNEDVETESNEKTIPKKADRMNADLAKEEVYNKLDQKAVTTWLDLRNKAAHGKDKEYSKEQVGLMLQGITEFLARVGI